MRIVNFILAFCALLLVLHLTLTVVTEKMSGSRWAHSPEGKAGVKSLTLHMSNPYVDGGSPVNSALVLAFNSQKNPPTIDSRLSTIYFDFEGQGQAVKTGWIDLGAGLLAVDHNGNHSIDDGRELFSNHSGPQPPSLQKALETLATHDTNGDGQLDSDDPIWPQLKIWSDIYRDEKIQRGLPESLESRGIQAIFLDFQAVDEMLPNGNYVQSCGRFQNKDGSHGQICEVRFQQQPSLRRFPLLAVSADLADSVPLVSGSGLVRTLPEAASLSPVVKQAVDDFSQSSTPQERLSALEPLLLAWASTADLPATLEERVYNRYTVVDDGLGPEAPVSSSQLRVLEAFIGRHIYLLPDELHPGQTLSEVVKVDERELTFVYPEGVLEDLSNSYQRFKLNIYHDLILAGYLLPAYELWSRGDMESLVRYFETQWANHPVDTLNSLWEFQAALTNRDRSADKTNLKQLETYIKSKVKESEINEE